MHAVMAARVPSRSEKKWHCRWRLAEYGDTQNAGWSVWEQRGRPCCR